VPLTSTITESFSFSDIDLEERCVEVLERFARVFDGASWFLTWLSLLQEFGKGSLSASVSLFDIRMKSLSDASSQVGDV